MSFCSPPSVATTVAKFQQISVFLALPWSPQLLRGVNAFLLFLAPLGRHSRCVDSTLLFVIAPLVATTSACFQHMYFCVFPWLPQPLRSVNTLFSLPVVATDAALLQHISLLRPHWSPHPLRTFKTCFFLAPLGRDSRCVASTNFCFFSPPTLVATAVA